jgi:ABC-type Fe3+ transport system substrate-binding protein
MTESNSSSGGFLGRAIVVLVVWIVLAGAAYFVYSMIAGSGKPTAADPGTTNQPSKPDEPKTTGNRIKVGIAYGTEKQRWLKTAVAEFDKTDAGKKYQIDLIPLGSVEGAQAIVNGDTRIHVWSPAAAMFREAFESDWTTKHSGKSPIAKQETLALSPMVFVFWDGRFAAFVSKYKTVNFKTMAQAASEKTGWAGIASKPDWGYFKFGHTHPGKSNSGLATLILMAYDHANKTDGLTNADVLTPEFQAFLTSLQANATAPIESTGTLMRDFVLKGPSAYDAVMVYENVAMDYLENAKGRWGEIRVVYPERNIWNDNPYYVLDVPWGNKQTMAGAEAFMEFLMSEPMQKVALSHGFRPGNPSVPTISPDSPLVRYEAYGIKTDVGLLCATPSALVQRTLQQGWERQFGGRR